MNTQNWSWQVPDENTDPWYAGMVALFQQIDATVDSVDTRVSSLATQVGSVAAIAEGFHTVVISATITGTTTYVGSSASANWFTMSAAAYGRFVGSFAIVASGANPLFLVSAIGQMDSGAANGAFSKSGLVLHRLIVNPGSIAIPSVNGDMWQCVLRYSDARVPLAFQAARSLGPGNYSVEAQVQLALVSATSNWVTQNRDWFSVIVVEGRRGL